VAKEFLLPNSFSAFRGMITCCSCHVNSSRVRSGTPKRAKGAASILRLLSIPRFRWSTSNEDDDKVTESSMQKFPAYVLHASMTALSQH
jgi:hypothetical protein